MSAEQGSAVDRSDCFLQEMLEGEDTAYTAGRTSSRHPEHVPGIVPVLPPASFLTAPFEQEQKQQGGFTSTASSTTDLKRTQTVEAVAAQGKRGKAFSPSETPARGTISRDRPTPPPRPPRDVKSKQATTAATDAAVLACTYDGSEADSTGSQLQAAPSSEHLLEQHEEEETAEAPCCSPEADVETSPASPALSPSMDAKPTPTVVVSSEEDLAKRSGPSLCNVDTALSKGMGLAESSSACSTSTEGKTAKLSCHLQTTGNLTFSGFILLLFYSISTLILSLCVCVCVCVNISLT